MHAAQSVRKMWAVSAVLFVFSLSLFTWKNDFPYYYHVDEPLEALLVLEGATHFHHPLLMGNFTDLVSRIFQVPRTPQPIVETGRWCMAVFGAIAVVALAWLAFRYGGLLAACAVGFLVALNPLLIEVTHYYKEDPALLMGLALSFLALVNFWERPSWKTIVLLGGANALAFSGKYIGIVAVILSVIVMFRVPLRNASIRRRVGFLLFALAFVAVVFGVNYQLYRGLGVMAGGVGREVVLLDDGGGKSLLTDKYLSIFLEHTNVVFWFFAGWWCFRVWQTRRVRTLPEYLMILFPFDFAVKLSLTTKTAGRYFLPAGAMICYLTGLGIADFCTQAAGYWKWNNLKKGLLAAGCIVVACATTGSEVRQTLQAFSRDSRRELAGWLQQHAPPDAIVAQDRRVQLAGLFSKETSDRAYTLTQKVLTRNEVADFGSVQELRDQGVGYVAIDAARKRKAGERRNFYKDLETTGELVWKGGTGPVVVLNPRLELYRLPPISSPGTGVP